MEKKELEKKFSDLLKNLSLMAIEKELEIMEDGEAKSLIIELKHLNAKIEDYVNSSDEKKKKASTLLSIVFLTSATSDFAEECLENLKGEMENDN